MVGAIGFEFWGTRSSNNIESAAGAVEQWRAVVAVLNGSQMDHERITVQALVAMHYTFQLPAIGTPSGLFHSTVARHAGVKT